MYLCVVAYGYIHPSAGLVPFQHSRCGVLPGCRARGDGLLRYVCHLQHRSGQSIDQRCLPGAAQTPRHSYLYGWERRLAIDQYEEIYLKAYDSVRAPRCAIAQCLDFYNSRRLYPHHQGTRDEACFASGCGNMKTP